MLKMAIRYGILGVSGWIAGAITAFLYGGQTVPAHMTGFLTGVVLLGVALVIELLQRLRIVRVITTPQRSSFEGHFVQDYLEGHEQRYAMFLIVHKPGTLGEYKVSGWSYDPKGIEKGKWDSTAIAFDSGTNKLRYIHSGERFDSGSSTSGMTVLVYNISKDGGSGHFINTTTGSPDLTTFQFAKVDKRKWKTVVSAESKPFQDFKEYIVAHHQAKSEPQDS